MGSPRLKWLGSSLILLGLLSPVHAAVTGKAPSSEGYLSIQGRRFIDTSGSHIILRGLNIGYSSVDPGSGGPSFRWNHGGPEVFERIRGWGYNCVRLVLYWSSVEPTCGEYNEAFLQDVDQKIEWARESGLHVILDMHQDLWGLGVPGGRGAPRWALVDPTPNHVEGQSVWSEAYFTSPLVQTAFDNFWNNQPGPDGIGIQARFALMWKHLAGRYAANTTVIGYDLLNEPFAGSPVRGVFESMTFQLLPKMMASEPASLSLDPNELGRRVMEFVKSDTNLYEEWLEAGDSAIEKLDRERISPMYQRVARAIREVDPHHILFTSTTICSNFGLKNGIQRITDEKGNPDLLQAFSPHIYDDDVDRIELTFNRLVDTSERLDIPLLVGEWGNLTNSDHIFQDDPIAPTQRLVHLFDAVQASDTYWYYMENLDKQPYFGTLLQRPFPTTVSGILKSYSFDPEQRSFRCIWSEDPSRGRENRFYLPPTCFPNGVQFEVSPPCVKNATVDESGRLHLPVVGDSIIRRTLEVFSKKPGDPQPLRNPQVIELGIQNVGTTVIGHLEGKPLFLTQGYRVTEEGKFPALECRDLEGRLHWRIQSSTPDYVNGEYLQWIDRGPDSEPMVLWTYFPNPQGGEGLGNQGGLYRIRDGKQVHRFPKASNNASFLLRSASGEESLIFSGQQFVQRFDLGTLQPRWEYDDRVFFCWGYPVYLPQMAGIAWGSEYNLPGGDTSSFSAIDLEGRSLWKVDGIPEDIGSTPLFPADVDSDGTVELVKNGLDLCGKNQLPFNHLYVLNLSGEILRKIPSMMYSTGLADLDQDGHIEAFGVISHRDGGRQALQRKELRCVDLADGEVEWETPVPRVGLPAANALAADVDGDGQMEALIADGNPVFYGHLEGPHWGSLYVVGAKGNLIQTVEFPFWARRLAMCDWDRDGRNNLLVQVDGDPATLYLFDTESPATVTDWPLPFGTSAHWGAEHRLRTDTFSSIHGR